MLKNMTLALAALTLTIGSAKAGDLMDDFARMDLATINDSAAEVEEFSLDALDVDQLADDAGADDTDAIEACFRRIGIRRGGWGRGGFGRGWGGGFGWRGGFRGGFHRLGYGYGCYHRPLYSCRPIVSHCYSYCRPVISNYWGCF